MEQFVLVGIRVQFLVQLSLKSAIENVPLSISISFFPRNMTGRKFEFHVRLWLLTRSWNCPAVPMSPVCEEASPGFCRSQSALGEFGSSHSMGINGGSPSPWESGHCWSLPVPYNSNHPNDAPKIGAVHGYNDVGKSLATFIIFILHMATTSKLPWRMLSPRNRRHPDFRAP
jgi:hypothetical protein